MPVGADQCVGVSPGLDQGRGVCRSLLIIVFWEGIAEARPEGRRLATFFASAWPLLTTAQPLSPPSANRPLQLAVTDALGMRIIPPLDQR